MPKPILRLLSTLAFFFFPPLNKSCLQCYLVQTKQQSTSIKSFNEMKTITSNEEGSSFLLQIEMSEISCVDTTGQQGPLLASHRYRKVAAASYLQHPTLCPGLLASFFLNICPHSLWSQLTVSGQMELCPHAVP